MITATLLTLAGSAACVAAAALLGWAVERWRRAQWERLEREAVPRLRLIYGGKRHDLRALARRTPTTRVRPVGGARSR